MSGNIYKDCCPACKTGRADTCHRKLNCRCHASEEAWFRVAYLPAPSDEG